MATAARLGSARITYAVAILALRPTRFQQKKGYFSWSEARIFSSYTRSGVIEQVLAGCWWSLIIIRFRENYCSTHPHSTALLFMFMSRVAKISTMTMSFSSSRRVCSRVFER
jgi:hypothetical protein